MRRTICSLFFCDWLVWAFWVFTHVAARIRISSRRKAEKLPTVLSLAIHLLIDAWVVSTSWLLWMPLLQTQVNDYLCHFLHTHIYIVWYMHADTHTHRHTRGYHTHTHTEWLDKVVVPPSASWGVSMLCSTVAVSLYIPISRTQSSDSSTTSSQWSGSSVILQVRVGRNRWRGSQTPSPHSLSPRGPWLAHAQNAGLLGLFPVSTLCIPHVRNGSPAPLDGQVITEYENMPKLKPQTASLELNPCKCPKWELEEAIRFHSCRRQACGVRPHAARGCLPGDSNYSIKTFWIMLGRTKSNSTRS